MENQIFRKKSVERVASPEQLNDYVRVANPGVWLALAAVLALLVGACIWGVFGRLDTTLTAVAIAEKGSISVYVKEADISSVEEGMTVTIADREYTVSLISAAPIAVTAELGDYALHLGGLQVGEWVYTVVLAGELADGIYAADILIDSVSPMSFVFN